MHRLVHREHDEVALDQNCCFSTAANTLSLARSMCDNIKHDCQRPPPHQPQKHHHRQHHYIINYPGHVYGHGRDDADKYQSRRRRTEECVTRTTTSASPSPSTALLLLLLLLLRLPLLPARVILGQL